MEPIQDLHHAGPTETDPRTYQTKNISHRDTRTSHSETRRIVSTNHIRNELAQREEAVQTIDTIRVICLGPGRLRFERETTFHHRTKEAGGEFGVDTSQSLEGAFEFDLGQFRNPVAEQTELLHVPRLAVKSEDEEEEGGPGGGRRNEINSILPHFRPSVLDDRRRDGEEEDDGYDGQEQRRGGFGYGNGHGYTAGPQRSSYHDPYTMSGGRR